MVTNFVRIATSTVSFQSALIISCKTIATFAGTAYNQNAGTVEHFHCVTVAGTRPKTSAYCIRVLQMPALNVSVCQSVLMVSMLAVVFLVGVR